MLRSRAIAEIALSRHGASLALVDRGQVVASRTFAWPLGEPFSGTRPVLLERYLVISQLAPQLAHLIELAGPVHSTSVSSALLCGDLPELRELAVLLEDEMGLEVEALDSSAVAMPGVAPRAGVPAVSRPGWSGFAMRRLAGAAALVLCASWTSLQVAGSSPASAVFPEGLPVAARAEPPAPSAPKPEATIGRMTPEPEPPRSTAPAPRPLTVEPMAASDPLPRVDGIAIAGERRLAIVDGAIVGPGDRVGRRTVRRIETGGVVLRDPGGREIFVAIRSRKPPPGAP